MFVFSGGSAIQSDDNRSEYYLFASLSRNTTIYNFAHSSVIVAAKSTSPTAPYTMLTPEAGPYPLGPRAATFWDGVWTQNPVIVRLRRSRGYLLFYAGGNDPGKHWSIGTASIGVAFASSLNGDSRLVFDSFLLISDCFRLLFDCVRLILD